MNQLTNEFLEELKKKTIILQSDLEILADHSIEDLNKRATPESWSALECIAHLNIYGDFYIPEIQKNIQGSAYKSPAKLVKGGLLGNYFVKMVGPLENSKKMKTLASSNPIGSKLDFSTLVKFKAQQEELLQLLEQAKNVDLNKTKTSISIAKWVKIRLGDAFRVVIFHNQRHMIQALNSAQ